MDQPVADLRVSQQRDVRLAVIGHGGVDLVGQDGDVRVAGEPGDEARRSPPSA